MLLQFWMILNAEALEVIAYLKTAPGKYVSLPEISRRAGGKRKFEESPGWAKTVMPTLVEAGFIEVNARGHYRVPSNAKPSAPPKPNTPAAPARRHRGQVLGDNYFPAAEAPRIVAGDYFPTSD